MVKPDEILRSLQSADSFATSASSLRSLRLRKVHLTAKVAKDSRRTQRISKVVAETTKKFLRPAVVSSHKILLFHTRNAVSFARFRAIMLRMKTTAKKRTEKAPDFSP